jgi:hypothetical protein
MKYRPTVSSECDRYITNLLSFVLIAKRLQWNL